MAVGLPPYALRNSGGIVYEVRTVETCDGMFAGGMFLRSGWKMARRAFARSEIGDEGFLRPAVIRMLVCSRLASGGSARRYKFF